MKHLLLGLVTTFAFGTAFAQSAAPVAATAPAAIDATATADAPATAPAAQEDEDQAAGATTPAEGVFTTSEAAPQSTTVPVEKVAREIPRALMGVGAAALVAVALTAGGGGSDDDDQDDGCRSPDDDCPSSP